MAGTIVVVLSAATVVFQQRETDPAVLLEHVPDGGIQPQAIADGHGGVHVVYFRGDAGAGDLFYVHRSATGAYGAPRRVNSEAGSAIARGTVRGAQLAAGRDGSLHVIWNGSPSARPTLEGGLPLFYSRLVGGVFAPQRNMLTTNAVDGGGAVVADSAGHVFVAWHAVPRGGREADGAVYLLRSDDDGATFGAERRVSDPLLGACGCCSMRGLIDREGGMWLLFRSAGAAVNRDTTLLVSRDLGDTFAATRLQPWRIAACPMSTYALAEGRDGVVSAWDTAGRIFVKRGEDEPRAVPGNATRRKHPVLAANGRGDMLVAWLEGTAWERGGSLAWQRYDAAGEPVGPAASEDGVPVWGLAAAAPLPDGGFLLLY